MPSDPLLEVRDLSIHLVPERNLLRGVSFTIPPAAIVGLSGDSGCGKTTLALAILKLLPPAQYRVTGQILLRGRDLLALDEAALETGRHASYAAWCSVRGNGGSSSPHADLALQART